MIRYPSILLIILILLLGISVYEIKSVVIKKEKLIISLKKDITRKKEHLNLLNAELAFLTRPERIEKIAVNLLNMKTILPIDIWSIRDLSNVKYLGLNK